MRLRTSFIVAAALAGALLAGPVAAQDKPPIRIGEINSYTGPAAAFTHSASSWRFFTPSASVSMPSDSA